MNVYSILKTPSLGELLLVANSTQLLGVYFSDCAHTPAARSEWQLAPGHEVLRQAETQIRDFLNGTRRDFSLPLHFAGTDLQTRVWQQITRIPFGQTITYSELARRAGAPLAIRAAGTATGRNPLSIIIPCHRVLGKDGSLHGYAGGLPRKQMLLELEQGSGIHPTKSSVKPANVPKRRSAPVPGRSNVDTTHPRPTAIQTTGPKI